MRIKELKIDKTILSFDDADNVFLINDRGDNPLGSCFYEFIDEVFSHTRSSFIYECDYIPVKRIKCVCEKCGNIFEISVIRNSLQITDDTNSFGVIGNFEKICRFRPKDNLPEKEKNEIAKALKRNFGNFLLPSALCRYYCGGTTEYVAEEADSFRTAELVDELRLSSPRYNDIINEFILSLAPIESYGKTFGFDKDGQPTVGGGYSFNNEEKSLAYILDYIAVNNLHQEILLAEGKDGNLPLFIHGAFRNLQDGDIKTFIDILRKIGRQIFISGEENNEYIEKYCDKIICFDMSAEDNNG